MVEREEDSPRQAGGILAFCQRFLRSAHSFGKRNGSSRKSEEL